MRVLGGRLGRLLFIGCAVFGFGCGAAHPKSRVATHRTFTPVRWDTLWYRRGSEQDTSLLMPTMIVADRRAVYALDIGAPRVVAFRTGNGRVEWMVGHTGGGPGEFRGPNWITLGPNGSIGVLDGRNNRLSMFQPDGSFARSIPLDAVPNALRACPFSHDDVLAEALLDGTPPLVRIDSTGRAIGRYDLPWPQLRRLPAIAGQLETVPVPDAPICVLATMLGPGFATINASGRFGPTHPYIEHFLPPEVIVSGHPPGAHSVRLAERRIAALSAAVKDDTISVLFGGLTSHRGRLLDFYRMKDGAYLGSVLLPHRAMSMARTGGTYFFLEYRGGLYDLLAARMIRDARVELEDGGR